MGRIHLRWPMIGSLVGLLCAAQGSSAQIGLVVAASAGQLTLSWQDQSSDETGFAIERSAPNDACEFVPLVTVPAETESWIDMPLATGVRWCYRVRAFNATGVSAPSNVACGTVAETATTASQTFVRTMSVPTVYAVPIGASTCVRLVGGTAEARILHGTTILARVALANPKIGVPFTITCTVMPTLVRWILNDADILIAPR